MKFNIFPWKTGKGPPITPLFLLKFLTSSIAKQGDNVLGSVCLSVCLLACIS